MQISAPFHVFLLFMHFQALFKNWVKIQALLMVCSTNPETVPCSYRYNIVQILFLLILMAARFNFPSLQNIKGIEIYSCT